MQGTCATSTRSGRFPEGCGGWPGWHLQETAAGITQTGRTVVRETAHTLTFSVRRVVNVTFHVTRPGRSLVTVGDAASYHHAWIHATYGAQREFEFMALCDDNERSVVATDETVDPAAQHTSRIRVIQH